MVSRMSEPFAHAQMFVSGVVINDLMNVEMFWIGCVNLIKEFQKIYPGTSGRDVSGLGTAFSELRSACLGDRFGTIIRTDVSGCAMEQK